MKAKKVSMTKTSISHPLRIDAVKAPDGRFLELWKSAGPKLREILLDGGKILIHCRGGIGRTGTVATRTARVRSPAIFWAPCREFQRPGLKNWN